MRNDDRTADDQPDVESVVQFGIGQTDLRALTEMVGDAIVAPQHERRDQPAEFLGAPVERAVFVRARIEIEEALDAQVPGVENLRVCFAPKFVELVNAVVRVGNRRTP